jgi:hypothetical protein|eukprot:COSAG03_NODE_416_length_8086_cov_5.782772_2_plen_82_part_00
MLVVVDAVTSLFLRAPTTIECSGTGARSKELAATGKHLVLVIVACTFPPVIILRASIVTMNSSGWLACAAARALWLSHILI